MKVLVAEDDPIVRSVILRAVEGLGWQAVAAQDGLAALAALSAGQELPHVAVAPGSRSRSLSSTWCAFAC